MAFLRVLESPDPALKDQTIPFTGKEVLIGRGKENGLVLEDNAVSRHHARIVEEPDGHVLIDNNSANGTWVNGQSVTEQRLKPGDQIRVGKTLFEIQGVYDPEGTALLDVQGMGMAMKAAPAPAPAPSVPVPVAAPAPPPPAPRPAAPVYDPPTTPDPVPMRRPAPPPTPVPGPPPAPARSAPMPPPAPAAMASRPAPIPPAPVAAGAPPAYFPDGAPIEGEPAGFWVRFVAYLIDSVIISVLMGIIWAPTMFLTMRSAMSEGGPGALAAILPFLAFLLTTAASLGYILWFWANRGATPGKKVMGLRIVREDGEEPLGWGTAFMRLVGYMVSGFILYIGFLMIAFNPDKQGLHDKIAKTRVLKIR
ncbi:MAG: RDD family protein [Holophagales bacterium]|nr:RDD family protein [Holophagales bacterium]